MSAQNRPVTRPAPTLAITLRDERVSRDLSQATVAYLIRARLGTDVSDRLVGAWELGALQPRIDAAEAWAAVLGFDLTLTRAVAS